MGPRRRGPTARSGTPSPSTSPPRPTTNPTFRRTGPRRSSARARAAAVVKKNDAARRAAGGRRVRRADDELQQSVAVDVADARDRRAEERELALPNDLGYHLSRRPRDDPDVADCEVTPALANGAEIAKSPTPSPSRSPSGAIAAPSWMPAVEPVYSRATCPDAVRRRTAPPPRSRESWQLGTRPRGRAARGRAPRPPRSARTPPPLASQTRCAFRWDSPPRSTVTPPVARSFPSCAKGAPIRTSARPSASRSPVASDAPGLAPSSVPSYDPKNPPDVDTTNTIPDASPAPFSAPGAPT
mgnify:CR=1 FL=1